MTEEVICQLIMVSGTTCASRGHQVYGNGMYTRMEKQQELRLKLNLLQLWEPYQVTGKWYAKIFM